jgi:hypothetical protein
MAEDKIREAVTSTAKTFFCSFCAKSQHEVLKLIAGPGPIFICNECVDLCGRSVRARRTRGIAVRSRQCSWQGNAVDHEFERIKEVLANVQRELNSCGSPGGLSRAAVNGARTSIHRTSSRTALLRQEYDLAQLACCFVSECITANIGHLLGTVSRPCAAISRKSLIYEVISLALPTGIDPCFSLERDALPSVSVT